MWTIGRSNETTSPTRLCGLMNRHAECSEIHIVVARQPGDVPVLFWTKIHRHPSTKSEKTCRSTISRPTTTLLQRNHLAPAASVIVDNNEHERHTKKLISPDLKNGEKTSLPIQGIDQHILTSTLRLRRRRKGRCRCGSRVICSNVASTTPTTHHNKLILTLNTKRRNEIPSLGSGKRRKRRSVLSPGEIGMKRSRRLPPAGTRD
jgi:hypothetical protein